MRAFAISLAVGIAVGVAYGILRVRSPAPPAIALLGLLGMLVGERLVPLAKKHLLGIADKGIADNGIADTRVASERAAKAPAARPPSATPPE